MATRRRKCSSYCFTDVATLALYSLKGKVDHKVPLWGEYVKWQTIKSFWLDAGTYHAFSVVWPSGVHCWKLCHQTQLETELADLPGQPEIYQYCTVDLSEGWYGLYEDTDILSHENIYEQFCEFTKLSGVRDYVLPKGGDDKTVKLAFFTGTDGAFKYYVHDNVLTINGAELSSIHSHTQKVQAELDALIKELGITGGDDTRLTKTLDHYVDSQALDESFWLLWRHFKHDIKKLGYSVKKTNGQFSLHKETVG